MKVAVLVALAVAGASCSVVHKFEYQPPEPLEVLPDNERAVDASFDETWSALVSSVGKSFFAIDHFEKDSGLLTLSFTTSPFSQSIDGGHCTFVYDNSAQADGSYFWTGQRMQKVKVNFDGNYADFIELYGNGVFSGRMNVVVKEEAPQRTRITINTRFVVSANSSDPDGSVHKYTWAWNSGEQAREMVADKDGNRSQRIMQSCGLVEKRILDAIDELFRVGG